MQILRPYQTKIINEINAAYSAGHQHVLAVSPTGSGKSVVIKHMINNHVGLSAVIAHRAELVLQMSLHLADMGIKHRIIASKSTITAIVTEHRTKYGQSFYDSNASASVISVDTLVSPTRMKKLSRWCLQVSFVVIDEAHHVLRDNKWGTAVKQFKNAKSLGVTATPNRADGSGLGAHAKGIYSEMIMGPAISELEAQGNLVPCKVYAPKKSIDDALLKIGATGDYTPNSMRDASEKSTITGDMVENYKKLTPNKQCVAFVADVKTAHKLAKEYCDAGFKAVAIDGTTPDSLRARHIREFREGKIQIITNVDLVGEGFDLPSLEVVQMGRPTQSLAVYMQQFGRAMRPAPGKPHGIIIDHVGNVIRHNLPEVPRPWTLDNRERRASSKAPGLISLTNCTSCFQVFPANKAACPHCGHRVRSSQGGGRTVEQVDGDLTLLTPDIVKAMVRAATPLDPNAQAARVGLATGGNQAAMSRAKNLAIAHNEEQRKLKIAMSYFKGYWEKQGEAEGDIYTRFYQIFGVDMLTAQTYNTKDATGLRHQIEALTGVIDYDGV